MLRFNCHIRFSDSLSASWARMLAASLSQVRARSSRTSHYSMLSQLFTVLGQTHWLLGSTSSRLSKAFSCFIAHIVNSSPICSAKSSPRCSSGQFITTTIKRWRNLSCRETLGHIIFKFASRIIITPAGHWKKQSDHHSTSCATR